MRTIVIVTDYADGPTGVFEKNDDGELTWLDGFDSNDADWRGEYFDPWLKKLGICVEYSHSKKLNSQVRDAMGYDAETS